MKNIKRMFRRKLKENEVNFCLVSVFAVALNITKLSILLIFCAFETFFLLNLNSFYSKSNRSTTAKGFFFKNVSSAGNVKVQRRLSKIILVIIEDIQKSRIQSK